jgi:nucleotide-binding universal stress UspA family protein
MLSLMLSTRPASAPALPAFTRASTALACCRALSSKSSRKALRSACWRAVANAASVAAVTVAPWARAARASVKVLVVLTPERGGLLALLLFLLVQAVLGVLELLHALAQAAHELGDLLAAEQEQ